MYFIAAAVGVVPRAVDGILWALLLTRVLGFDPLVAVSTIVIRDCLRTG